MSTVPHPADLTIPALLSRNARELPTAEALTSGIESRCRTLTWAQLRAEVVAFAGGLRASGLRRGDRMLIVMAKRQEHWVADLAAAHLGVISCSTYESLSDADIRHIAAHSQASAVVLENATQAARWMPVLRELPRPPLVVLVDGDTKPGEQVVRFHELQTLGHGRAPERSAALAKSIRPEDPLCMIYTSGTTSTPKAVVLSHRNVLSAAAALDASVPGIRRPRSISYLPLAHIAERILGIYLPLFAAGHVTICDDPAQLEDVLRAVQPDFLGGVPRTWEKLALRLRTLRERLQADQRAAAEQAHRAVLDGHRSRASGVHGPTVPSGPAVLRDLRAAIGLEKARRLTVGAAPMSTAVLDELAGFGLSLLELYGLSETAGVVTLSRPDRFAIGAVGTAIDATEIRIAADGEILVRGPSVFLGYLGADGCIEPAIDSQGWFATGDVGHVDDRGFLYITGRKKDLIITSGGKNIAPAKIEELLLDHPLLGHAMVVGDRRKYLTALLTLDEHSATWAAAHGIDVADLDALAGHPKVWSELDRLVADTNAKLSKVEQIKAYHVLGRPWSVATGELTPTLKMRRSRIVDRYAAQIDGMYP
ncbi:AMP-dependent synthetase/ligase [Saccharopolyspora spinosa]|uniref:Acyl-CoA synthetase n=1 Tax=Saccharopolyspora spinosa TaxID=60894 RepID=A0A2N3Y1S5_SACSN|nr:AMP-dependent synthetase/ligase [Saccharopolyspora spinosa]PKW16840.1 long-chain acyl-CoA synthetase [Saccharopolyspora spinosa]